MKPIDLVDKRSGGLWFGNCLVTNGEYKICSIGIHKNAHLDEFVAALIIQLYGDMFFPGASEANIVLVNGGSHQPKSAFEYLRDDGTLLVGAGNSPFNEH